MKMSALSPRVALCLNVVRYVKNYLRFSNGAVRLYPWLGQWY